MNFIVYIPEKWFAKYFTKAETWEQAVKKIADGLADGSIAPSDDIELSESDTNTENWIVEAVP